MELGNQIRTLRLRRGITQEAMAQHFGVTAQAVSKWERGIASPDIDLLPGLSAYFGVTIDELFALSDETRMERIQNMIWDVRYLNPADVENQRHFLLEKARRESENGRPHELLADLENHLAREHRERAAEFAKEALRREPTRPEAHASLVEALGGVSGDWNLDNHHALISCYQDFIEEHPHVQAAYLWLLDQLIDASRLEEAKQYLERFAAMDNTHRTLLFRSKLLWAAGDREGADACWAEMQARFPDKWVVWLNMGDIAARRGRYEEAKQHYRKGLALMEPPRYVDALECIAQICEIQGDYAGAIDALREELKLDETDWNCTTGETVDVVVRQIARLEKKMK